MTTSRWVAAIRGSSASTNSAASATVLCIFQLAAMYGVRSGIGSPPRRAGPPRPGSFFPSSSSKDAPPPVESQSTLSARPNLRSAATESPPPTTVVPGAAATASATRAGAGGERLQLEGAHRAVPEHGAGRGDRLGVGAARARADVEAHPAVGHLDPVALARARCRRRSSRRARGRPAGAARSRMPSARSSASAASSTPSSSTSESPVAIPWARKKLKHIAPPIRISVGDLEEAVDHADLVGDLGAAEDDDQRPLRATRRRAVSSVTSRSSSSPA